MAIDPNILHEFNYNIDDLNESINTLNSTMLGVMGIFAPVINKKNELDNQLAEIETEITDAIKNNTSQSIINSKRRKRQYLQELRYRNYSIDSNGKAVKSKERLNAEQREKLYWLNKQVIKDQELSIALDKPVETFRKMSASIHSFDGILEKQMSTMIDGTNKNVLAAVSLTLLYNVSKGLFSTFGTMTDALYQGERGASVAAKGYKAFADATANAITGVGVAITLLPFGKYKLLLKSVGASLAFLGIAAKSATKIIEVSAEVNDKLYNQYNKLSQFGLTTSESMTGLFNTIQEFGVTTSGEFEKFNKLLSDSAKNLTIFGGTATSGLKFYKDIANKIVIPQSKIGKSLELLGITADQQREGIVKFLTEETRLGLLNNKNESLAQKNAVLYLEKLDRITRLTGITREEQQQARDAIIADDALRAAIFEAEQDRSKEGQKKLARLKRAFEAASMLSARGDIRGATGVAEYAAGGGITGQASAVAFQTFGGRNGLLDIINRGGDETEIITAIGRGYKRQLDRMAPTIAIAGFQAGSDYITANVGVAVDAERQIRQFVEEAQKLGKTPSEYLKYLQDEAKEKPDETLNQNVEARRIQQQAALTIDKAAVKFGLGTTALEAASKMMKEAVDLFTRTQLPKQQSPSLEDVKKQTDKQTNVAQQSYQKLQQLKKENASPAQIKEAEIQLDEDNAKVAQSIREQQEAALREKNERKRKNRTRGIEQQPVTEESSPEDIKVTKPVSIKIDDLLIFGSNTGSKKNFDMLNPKLQQSIISAAIAYNNETGKKLTITSANRTYEDQLRLWNETVDAKRPGIGPTGMKVGRPGTSSHEHGHAVDIQEGKNDSAAINALNMQGLFQTVPNDPVHFTFKKAQTGGMFEGPSDGYFVELHGKEFVGNEKHMEQFKKLINFVEQNALLEKTTIYQEPETSYDYSDMLISLSEMIETKVVELTEKVREGNSTDEDLLNYSRA